MLQVPNRGLHHIINIVLFVRSYDFELIENTTSTYENLQRSLKDFGAIEKLTIGSENEKIFQEFFEDQVNTLHRITLIW